MQNSTSGVLGVLVPESSEHLLSPPRPRECPDLRRAPSALPEEPVSKDQEHQGGQTSMCLAPAFLKDPRATPFICSPSTGRHRPTKAGATMSSVKSHSSEPWSSRHQARGSRIEVLQPQDIQRRGCWTQASSHIRVSRGSAGGLGKHFPS